MLDKRGHVGADEHLAVADADDQRCGAARGDNGAGLVSVGEHQGEVAFQAAQHGQRRSDEITCGLPVVIRLRHQVDGHLGVGVAGELHAGRLQLTAQAREVLDDAVVDDGDLARRITVRVGVAVGGTAVGGPAGVTEAGGAGQCRRVGVRERALQVGQSAGPPSYRQLAGRVQQCNARRVVAAVFHPAQGVDDDVTGRLMPDVADDSAHNPPE